MVRRTIRKIPTAQRWLANVSQEKSALANRYTTSKPGKKAVKQIVLQSLESFLAEVQSFRPTPLEHNKNLNAGHHDTINILSDGTVEKYINSNASFFAFSPYNCKNPEQLDSFMKNFATLFKALITKELRSTQDIILYNPNPQPGQPTDLSLTYNRKLRQHEAAISFANNEEMLKWYKGIVFDIDILQNNKEYIKFNNQSQVGFAQVIFPENTFLVLAKWLTTNQPLYKPIHANSRAI